MSIKPRQVTEFSQLGVEDPEEAIYFSLIASSEAKRNKKDEKLSKTRRNKKNI